MKQKMKPEDKVKLEKKMGSDGLTIDVLFKQTTSERIKCKKCRKSVEGEDGYVKVNMDFYTTRLWRRVDHEKKVVICPNCFKEWLNRITDGEKNKKESYNKLVKTKILGGLRS